MPNQRHTSVIWNRRDSRNWASSGGIVSCVELGALVEHDRLVRRVEPGALRLPPRGEAVGLRLGQPLLGLQDAGRQRAGAEQLGAVLLGGQAEADGLTGGADRGDAADAVVAEPGGAGSSSSPSSSLPPSIA